MRRLLKSIILFSVWFVCSGWGFFAHQKINRLAVFILPPQMSAFYKKNIQYVTEAAVNPDRRRYTVSAEAARHYIDLDQYTILDRTELSEWTKAVARYGEDSLQRHGIVPWHITRMYFQLRDAFLTGDPKEILRLSAELGHYVADAHVPLHTTSNYDGLKTDQRGIHAFWESRLPELYSTRYDFFVGKASRISNIQVAAWAAVQSSHAAVDSVLDIEKLLFKKDGDKKFNFETKGKKTIKVIAPEYARRYHDKLAGMVERRMRRSIKMIGDLWYTAWIDAGQPDLERLMTYTPSEEELDQRRKELILWKEKNFRAREHESE